MQEMSIMEIFKWIIGIFAVIFFIALAVFFVQLGEVNSFKQHVNYQIERNGGLTKGALDNINKHSNDYYDGRYTLESNKLNRKLAYGETIDYTVNGVFEVIIPTIPDIKMQFSGTGVSQIR